METYSGISELLSTHRKFKNMRDAIDVATKPPVIPYLGIYLADLDTMESVNPDRIEGVINFNKKRLCYKVIRSLQTFQKHSKYDYHEITYLHKVLKHFVPEKEDNHLYWSDEKMFDESVKLEPKEAH